MIESLIGVVLVLGGLNVYQFIFWSSQVNKLLNKLMSRNYAEYVSAEKYTPPEPKKITLDPDLSEETEILTELNGMLT